MSTEFEKLADELGLLAKAQPKEDEKVLESAREGGVDVDGMAEDMAEPDAEDYEDDDKDAANAEGDDDVPMGKSYSLTDDSGETFEGYDATDLIKALSTRLGGLEHKAAVEDTRHGHLSRSLVIMTHVLQEQDKTLQKQAEQIASLQKSLGSVSQQGVGRRAVLNVAEKPDPMIKSAQPEGVDGRTFMAKAMEAMSSGRITSRDVSIAESSLNRGIPVDAAIVQRVMGTA